MRERRTHSEDEGLDLIPMMNLVSLLIPLLLLGATFVNLATIDSTLPAISNTPSPCADCEAPLQLSVLITDRGFTISGADEVLGAQATAEGPTLPCDGGRCAEPASYPYDDLTALLGAVKDAHPDDQRVTLVPEDRIPYEVLIHTLDAAREAPAADGARRLLFPAAAFASGAL